MEKERLNTERIQNQLRSRFVLVSVMLDNSERLGPDLFIKALQTLKANSSGTVDEAHAALLEVLPQSNKQFDSGQIATELLTGYLEFKDLFDKNID